MDRPSQVSDSQTFLFCVFIRQNFSAAISFVKCNSQNTSSIQKEQIVPVHIPLNATAVIIYRKSGLTVSLYGLLYGVFIQTTLEGYQNTKVWCKTIYFIFISLLELPGYEMHFFYIPQTEKDCTVVRIILKAMALFFSSIDALVQLSSTFIRAMAQW